MAKNSIPGNLSSIGKKYSFVIVFKLEVVGAVVNVFLCLHVYKLLFNANFQRDYKANCNKTEGSFKL